MPLIIITQMLPFLLPYQHALASSRLARWPAHRSVHCPCLTLIWTDLYNIDFGFVFACWWWQFDQVYGNQCLWTDKKLVPNLSRVKMEQRQNTNVWLKFNNESGLPARIWTHCCNLMTCGHRRHKLHGQDCGPCHDSHPESGSPEWGDAHGVLQKTGLDIISSWQQAADPSLDHASNQSAGLDRAKLCWSWDTAYHDCSNTGSIQAIGPEEKRAN